MIVDSVFNQILINVASSLFQPTKLFFSTHNCLLHSLLFTFCYKFRSFKNITNGRRLISGVYVCVVTCRRHPWNSFAQTTYAVLLFQDSAKQFLADNLCSVFKFEDSAWSISPQLASDILQDPQTHKRGEVIKPYLLNVIFTDKIFPLYLLNSVNLKTKSSEYFQDLCNLVIILVIPW